MMSRSRTGKRRGRNASSRRVDASAGRLISDPTTPLEGDEMAWMRPLIDEPTPCGLHGNALPTGVKFKP